MRHLEEVREPECSGMCAPHIDQLVVGQLFKALEPAALELSLQAMEDERQERERLHKHWSQQCERARYEADRAERQFQAVEPENRLVGRSLEQKWEAALVKLREAEEEWRRFCQATPKQISAEERERILALSKNLSALWNAEHITNADRKEIIRCLVDRVVVHARQNSEHVDVTIHWHEGYTSQHQLIRPVNSYRRMTTAERLQERIVQLRQAGRTAAQIATTLTQEGFMPPRRCQPFSKVQVWQLMHRFGLTKPRDHVDLEPHEWRLSAFAQELGVPILRLRDWAQKGWVHARQTPTQGLWIVWADPDEVERLRRLTAHSHWGVQHHPVELTTPKPRE